MKFFSILFVFFCVLQPLHAQHVGVGTDNPQEFFSVGASSQFRVNASGDLVRINNVQYNFPTVQATSGSVLANDGSGNLSWTKVTTGNISATGTASNTTFLRGDGSWQTPAGGAAATMVADFTTTGSLTISTSEQTITLANDGINVVNGVFTAPTNGIYLFYVETQASANSSRRFFAQRNGVTVYVSNESVSVFEPRANNYAFTSQMTSGQTMAFRLISQSADFNITQVSVRIIRL